MSSGYTLRRSGLAVIAIAVWVGGFELAPAAHVAFHGLLPAHRHGDGHGHVHEAEGHGGFDRVARLRALGEAGGLARASKARPAGARGATGELPAEHGAGALAHRDLAAGGAPPGLPPVDPAIVGGAIERPRPGIVDEGRPVAEARARAPPRS